MPIGPFPPGDFDPDPARTPIKVPDLSKSLKSRSTGCILTAMLSYDCALPFRLIKLLVVILLTTEKLPNVGSLQTKGLSFKRKVSQCYSIALRLYNFYVFMVFMLPKKFGLHGV